MMSNDQNSKSGREMVYGPKDFCLEIRSLDDPGSTFLKINQLKTGGLIGIYDCILYTVALNMSN